MIVYNFCVSRLNNSTCNPLTPHYYLLSREAREGLRGKRFLTALSLHLLTLTRHRSYLSPLSTTRFMITVTNRYRCYHHYYHYYYY